MEDDITIGTLGEGEQGVHSEGLTTEKFSGTSGYLIQVFDYGTGTSKILGVYRSLEDAQAQAEGYELSSEQLVAVTSVSFFIAKD